MYQVTYLCSNCYTWMYLSIPKKKEAPTYVCCPVCGLDTSNKTDRQPKDGIFPTSYEYEPKTEGIKTN